MTISTVYTPPQYTGNGVTTTFAFPYTFYDNTDLIVTSTVIATGVSTTLTLSDYSVTGGNGSTGSVILNTAPSSAIRITIERAIPYLQGSDFAENTGFPAETIERTFDKSVIMAQQVLEKANRAIRFPVGASVSSNDVSGTIDLTPRVLTVTTSGVSTSTLGSITTTIDTVFTGLASGDFLSYDGVNWVNVDNPTTSLLSSNNTFSGANSFTGLNTFRSSIAVSGTASEPASLTLAEDTDNGTNKITVIAPASLAADYTLTLPATTGTVALLSDVPSAVGQAKAWAYVTWSAGTPTLQDSFNVSGITDLGDGNLRVTFTTPFATANYATNVTPRDSSAAFFSQVQTQATGSIDLFIFQYSTGNAADPTALSVVCFGDQ